MAAHKNTVKKTQSTYVIEASSKCNNVRCPNKFFSRRPCTTCQLLHKVIIITQIQNKNLKVPLNLHSLNSTNIPLLFQYQYCTVHQRPIYHVILDLTSQLLTCTNYGHCKLCCLIARQQKVTKHQTTVTFDKIVKLRVQYNNFMNDLHLAVQQETQADPSMLSDSTISMSIQISQTNACTWYQKCLLLQSQLRSYPCNASYSTGDST